ncbi:hypothetical protein KP509_31G065400 [Ceratopteris richardii]|uniref:AUGMIN subunit 5 n=1 Tax=Ceratopteris richardii TaxID=49495 RepID=A0A8T2R0M7_CERRI|nr:hypothetical protein KP509_31G065400 [Ceratopteris richardii]
MQGSNVSPQAEAILDWLKREMGYRPQSPYQNSEKLLPSIESLRRICRGNMLPVWKFLLERVKSEKTVEIVKRNILVHGSPTSSPQPKSTSTANAGAPFADAHGAKTKGTVGKEKDTAKPGGRRRPTDRSKARGSVGDSTKAKDGSEMEKEKLSDGTESKEKALREREAAELEVERLRHVLDRLRKDLKGRMLELSREEEERQRVLDEKYDSRHKQVMLEAYDERCEQAARIFAEYQRRLHRYVEQAMDVQKGKAAIDVPPNALSSHNDLDTVYATSVKSGKSADGGPILIETLAERNVRKACEELSSQILERLKGIFPAYDGSSNQSEVNAEERRLGADIDWESVPEVVKETAASLLKNPPQLLRALAGYTAQVVSSITQEIEKIDIKADAERLRYRYENNKIVEDVSVDADESLLLHSRSSEIGIKGTFRQLRERQKAHVQQFMATEEALNAAADAKKASQELIQRIHGGSNGGDASNSSTGSSRQFELDVWAKERELAGLKASVSTLSNEVHRLQKLCEERRAAEEALRKKWKRIEEFDGRRTDLESIYTELIQLNMAAASSWEQHAQRSREYSATTVIPLCRRVQQKAEDAHDLLEKEVVVFRRVPDNRLYMLPSTQQYLLDSMGAGGPGPESLAAAERQADLITAKAGARDPSAIPSIQRINAATRHISGYDGPDAGLYSVIEALRFMFSPCSSPACLMEDLAKAMRQIQTSKNLVNNARSLLSAANNSRPEHERNVFACSSMASEQDKVAMEEWLPELKVAVEEAQKCLDDCKRVRGMVDEWWEQPASTAVDWITVDGQNVATWLAHVKQLQTAFYDKQLL